VKQKPPLLKKTTSVYISTKTKAYTQASSFIKFISQMNYKRSASFYPV